MSDYREKIIRFYKKHKRMPNFREIMEVTGLKSKNSVSKLIDKLILLDVVEKDRSGKIIPKKLFGETKILGMVEAGFPSPAEEELVDTITIDEYLISNKEATYILNVSGDSMIDAGIRPGDMVLAERNKQPKDGDIVIAEVDGQWTIKYFRKRGAKIVLVPANKKYRPIHPKEELKIAAVVIGVVRKYV
jgi:SOS regulatory protein LexA